MAGVHRQSRLRMEQQNMITVKASIYRTDEKQISEKGRNAWVDMMFTGSSMAAVEKYCEILADGIIDPIIIIQEITN